MFSEFDVVILKKSISSRNLYQGMRGTIVFVYHDPNLPQDYEVEFFDEDGNTLDVVTIGEEYLEKKQL